MDAKTFSFLFISLFSLVYCDTPAYCTVEDILGKWQFFVGEADHDRTLICDSKPSPVNVFTITLKYPDIVEDQFGNLGFWTIIYNQGFEVVVHGRKYFAFSDYETEGKRVTSKCYQTRTGWSHTVLGDNWACYVAKKISSHAMKFENTANKTETAVYRQYASLVGDASRSWTAAVYPQLEHLPLSHVIKMAGGERSRTHRPKTAKLSSETARLAAKLPKEFDWRNANGVNYVSPVRNQGGCGSCYSFASLAMNEARIRIWSNNSLTPVFSPQDVVECSQYSQGCDGGFPYLIGGKYAEDYGLVKEKCNTYKGEDGQCSTDKTCQRHYSTQYKYVGGYYGACNEEEMKIALMRGPIAVGFEVYHDFMQYKGGVYQHSSEAASRKHNPFELTNHAVLVVGYGMDAASGLDYWTVKNSWGASWGEEGFFRIRRGNDECGMESMAVEGTPIF